MWCSIQLWSVCLSLWPMQHRWGENPTLCIFKWGGVCSQKKRNCFSKPAETRDALQSGQTSYTSYLSTWLFWNDLQIHVCTIKLCAFQNKVPRIALLGSGGGQRAMVGLSERSLWIHLVRILRNVLGYVCNPSSSKERDTASKDAKGTPPAWPCSKHMCNLSNRWARRHRRVT